MGMPAAVKRELSPEAIDEQRCHARRYAQLAALPRLDQALNALL